MEFIYGKGGKFNVDGNDNLTFFCTNGVHVTPKEISTQKLTNFKKFLKFPIHIVQCDGCERLLEFDSSAF
jgi:hypothetical protein